MAGCDLYTRPTMLHALLERVITPGQKLWQTVLGEEFSCSQLLFNMHSGWPNFSPLEGVWGLISFGFWYSHKFPMVPSDVPQVLNVFPRHVPNSTTLYSIICAQSWTYITCKGGPKGITSRLIFWECPMFQKEMWWANQSDSLPPKPPKKNYNHFRCSPPTYPPTPKLITTTNNRYNLQTFSGHGCMSSPMNKVDKEARHKSHLQLVVGGGGKPTIFKLCSYWLPTP
jgi:hypothetical protein